MKIEYFIKHYDHGKGFKPFDKQNNGAGVYILVCNSEVVYIGSSKSVNDRIAKHKRNLLFDEALCWITGDGNNPGAVSAAYAYEQHAISYCTPILNNNKFIEFEKLYNGNPQTLEFVLGYTSMLKQFQSSPPKASQKEQKSTKKSLESKGRPLKDSSKGLMRDYCKTINIAIPIEDLDEVNELALPARGLSLTDYYRTLTKNDLKKNREKYKNLLNNMKYDLI